MINKVSRSKMREVRHARLRKTVFGTGSKPRLSVFRSNTNIAVQIIDDEKGVTLVSASSLEKALKITNGSNIEASKIVGAEIAKRAVKAGIKEVVFDRGGFAYHGRVAALADSARENGLEF